MGDFGERAHLEASDDRRQLWTGEPLIAVDVAAELAADHQSLPLRLTKICHKAKSRSG